MMSVIQLESVAPPFDAPGVGPLAVRVLTVAESTGLLPADRPVRTLDRALLERVTRAASATAGIGRGLLAELRQAEDRPEALGAVLRRLYDALERSPTPTTEWPAMERILGADLLSSLLGISASSLRRYVKGARHTPDAVAVRLHFLALVVADLAGSYNELGVRQWFERRRVQLDGKAPAQLLRGEWSVESSGATRVRELARALIGPLGT